MPRKNRRKPCQPDRGDSKEDDIETLGFKNNTDETLPKILSVETLDAELENGNTVSDSSTVCDENVKSFSVASSSEGARSRSLSSDSITCDSHSEQIVKIGLSEVMPLSDRTFERQKNSSNDFVIDIETDLSPPSNWSSPISELEDKNNSCDKPDVEKFTRNGNNIVLTTADDSFPASSGASNDTYLQQLSDMEIDDPYDYDDNSATTLGNGIDLPPPQCINPSNLLNISLSDIDSSSDGKTSSNGLQSPSTGANVPCHYFNCTESGSKTCAQCKKVSYCSAEHQRLDWKRHKYCCSPFKMSLVQSLYYEDVVPTATRDISEGSVILREPPLLVFPLASPIATASYDHVLDLSCCTDTEWHQTCDLSYTYNPSGVWSLSHQYQKNNNKDCGSRRSKPSCLGCMKPDNELSYRCSKCELPLCSAICEDKPFHRDGECKAIKECSNLDKEILKRNTCLHTLYLDVEILRGLQLKKDRRNAWDALMTLKLSKRVAGYRKSKRFEAFVRNIEFLVPISLRVSNFDRETIKDLHAIFNCLSFYPSLHHPYKALYVTVAIFAQNCSPNTLRYTEAYKVEDEEILQLVIKANRSILKNDLISVDVSPSPFSPRSFRRRLLSNLYSITNCTCTRCKAPFRMGDRSENVRCPHCTDGECYPESLNGVEPTEWPCSKCPGKISQQNAVMVVGAYYDSFIDLKKKYPSSIEKLLEWIRKVSDVVGPFHYIILCSWCEVENILRDRFKNLEPNPENFTYDYNYKDFELLTYYTYALDSYLLCVRSRLDVDRGFVLYYKFWSLFFLTLKKYKMGGGDSKQFIADGLKCLKVLKASLEVFSLNDGFNRKGIIAEYSNHISHSYTVLKDYMKRFIAVFK